MPSGSALSLAGEARQPQKRPLTPAARSAPIAASAPGAARLTTRRVGVTPTNRANTSLPGLTTVTSVPSMTAPSHTGSTSSTTTSRRAPCARGRAAEGGGSAGLGGPAGAAVALGQLEPLDLRPGPSPLGLERNRARLGVGERGTRARQLGLCCRPRRLGGAGLLDGFLQALVTAGLAALERSGQLGRLPLGRRERGGEQLGSVGGAPRVLELAREARPLHPCRLERCPQPVGLLAARGELRGERCRLGGAGRHLVTRAGGLGYHARRLPPRGRRPRPRAPGRLDHPHHLVEWARELLDVVLGERARGARHQDEASERRLAGAQRP